MPQAAGRYAYTCLRRLKAAAKLKAARTEADMLGLGRDAYRYIVVCLVVCRES